MIQYADLIPILSYIHFPILPHRRRLQFLRISSRIVQFQTAMKTISRKDKRYVCNLLSKVINNRLSVIINLLICQSVITKYIYMSIIYIYIYIYRYISIYIYIYILQYLFLVYFLYFWYYLCYMLYYIYLYLVYFLFYNQIYYYIT